MVMKIKVMCPNCQHVFGADEENEIEVKCSECDLNFTVMDGKKTLNSYITTMTKKGFKYYTRLKFKESNECYKEVLNLDPGNFDILTRYSLNLLYLNTYTESNYDKIIPLFEEHEITLDKENTYLLLAFLKDLVQNFHIFIKYYNEKIIVDGSFINEKYVKPYFKGLKDIKSLYDYFDEVFALLHSESRATYFEDNASFMDRYSKYKAIVTTELKKTFNLVNKGDFTYNEEKDEIEYLNTNIVKKEETELEDEQIIVPDKNFQKQVRTFYIVLGALLLIALILLIVGLSIANSAVTYCAFIPLGLALVYMIIYFKKTTK